MNKPRSIRHLGRWSTLLLGLIALLFWLVAPPMAALAHPLDEYLQAAYLTVAPDHVLVEMNMTAGVLVAPELITLLDRDANSDISAEEQQTYAQSLQADLTLERDGQSLPLVVTDITFPPMLNLEAGYGIILIELTALLPTTTATTHQLSFANNHQPVSKNSYQANGFVGSDETTQIDISQQQRDELQRTISINYTTTPVILANETDQRELPETTEASSSERLVSFLYQPLDSPWVLAAAVGLAVLLGALHALTPGHGKTLIAAYLIGSQGTLRQAVILGGIVTFTHTASVIAIGLVVLFASQYIVPDLFVPALEVSAGLLVVWLGIRLILVRWRGLRQNALHPHVHRLPETIKLGDLLTMGVSGGIVPCPEALGLLLIAVGLNKSALGVGMIVAFSLGLAGALIALGIILVRAKSAVGKYMPENPRWQQLLPLISSVVITLLGMGIAVKGWQAGAFAPGDLLVMGGTVGLLVLLYSFIARQWQNRKWQSRLPARYRSGAIISATPMGAAELQFDPNGAVAWDTIWTEFCDLALAGGPPHRGSLLQSGSVRSIQANTSDYQEVLAELARGLGMVTGLKVITDASPGWIGVICDSEEMARWLRRAIEAENVDVRREGAVLFAPVGADFRLEYEIKNVVTVFGKTCHYWSEHLNERLVEKVR